MLKRTFTYKDYYGNERTEEHYFNLNESEVMKLEMSSPGGLTAYLQRIISAQNGKMIMDTFEKIILMAYGEKSLDGRQFIKSDELSKAFKETEPFNQLFMEVCFNAEKAAQFINAVVPAEKIVLSGEEQAPAQGAITALPAASSTPAPTV